MAEERKKRLADRKEKRKEDRRTKWIEEKKEAEQRAKDEELLRGMICYARFTSTLNTLRRNLGILK